jgi:hypothetical protein
MTPGELAVAAGVTASAVQHWLARRRGGHPRNGPSRKEALILAQILGVTVEELLAGGPASPPAPAPGSPVVEPAGTGAATGAAARALVQHLHAPLAAVCQVAAGDITGGTWSFPALPAAAGLPETAAALDRLGRACIERAARNAAAVEAPARRQEEPCRDA